MRGINLIEPLFHRVVSGENIQTQRIIKPQPDDSGLHDHDKYPMSISPEYDMTGFWGEVKETGESKEFKPRYRRGETCYLKEPYCQDCNYIENENSKEWKGNGRILYRYSGDQISEHAKGSVCFGKWKNRLSMPAEFARYFIEITAVRAERLQDISDCDCIREGIGFKDVYEKVWSKTPTRYYFDYSFKDYENWLVTTPKQSYAALIDRINGKGTWESNPFVWVYDFTLITEPVFIDLNK